MKFLYPKSKKCANRPKEKFSVAHGVCAGICIAYDKMILWMKIIVVSAFVRVIVEARHSSMTVGRARFLKLDTLPVYMYLRLDFLRFA